MEGNKIILIVVLLLVIVGGGYLLFSSFNSHDDVNVTGNIINTNTSLDVNESLNTSDNDTFEDGSSYSQTSSDSYSDSSGYSDYKLESDDSDEFSASDARKVVNDYVGGVDDYDISDLKIGKPKHKNSNDGWLVPLYDKKTGKFVDSVYAYDDGMTHGGVHDHDNYKRIISGKKPKKSSSKFVNLRD